MVVLLWIVRIYKYWLFAWVVMTWIPFVAGSPFHQIIGIPVLPILNIFNFLHIGFIGLGAIIPLFALNYAETWLVNRIQAQQAGAAGQPLPPASAPVPAASAPAADQEPPPA